MKQKCEKLEGTQLFTQVCKLKNHQKHKRKPGATNSNNQRRKKFKIKKAQKNLGK